MSDKNWVLVGGILIIVLLGGIFWVFVAPKSFFGSLNIKTKEVVKKPQIRLNEDYQNPELFTEISVNDVLDGTILREEMKNAIPFGDDTLPMKYRREDVGNYNSKLLIDDVDYVKLRANLDKAPFRNLYFYKIKSGEKWLTIMGQQVRNGDGSSTFLHFLIHQGEEVYSWGNVDFGFQPLMVAPYQYFDDIAPKEFFSTDPNYYEKGTEIDQLMTQWQQTGIVPDSLSRKILFAEIKM